MTGYGSLARRADQWGGLVEMDRARVVLIRGA